MFPNKQKKPRKKGKNDDASVNRRFYVAKEKKETLWKFDWKEKEKTPISKTGIKYCVCAVEQRKLIINEKDFLLRWKKENYYF